MSRMSCRWMMAVALAASFPGAPGMAVNELVVDPEVRLVSAERIWDGAPHNAFTGLARFHDRWYVAFREGERHGVDYSGSIRVLASNDGSDWESVALMEDADSDLRDAHLEVTAEGELMLLGVRSFGSDHDPRHQPVAWFTRNGDSWTDRIEIAEADYWLWSITWNPDSGYGYGIGYHTPSRDRVRLYRTADGRDFEVLVPDLGLRDYPNESSIVFGGDGTAYALLRRDGGNREAEIGVARPPYTEWRWKSLGLRLGGPEMLMLPDGRLLATVRMYPRGGTSEWETWVGWIDPDAGSFKPALRLPSGGDTSYAGMRWHDGRVWISYYSSHESRSKIYFAQVEIEGIGR